MKVKKVCPDIICCHLSICPTLTMDKWAGDAAFDLAKLTGDRVCITLRLRSSNKCSLLIFCGTVGTTIDDASMQASALTYVDIGQEFSVF